MLTIRRYLTEDNAAIKELHFAGIEQMREMDPIKGRPDIPNIDGYLDDIERVYINNRGDFLVGLLNNEIVAMGALKKFSETCSEIKRIRIRRDCQRQGHGQTILLKLIEIASELGYTEVCLDTLANNLPAQRLFEKLGFSETHRRPFGAHELVFYHKSLDNEINKKGG